MNVLGLLSSLPLLVQSSSYPTGVTIDTPGQVQPGVTIEISDYKAYQSQAAQEIRVRSQNGSLVHTWTSPLAGWNVGELAKPLSNGHVLAFLYDMSRPSRRMVVEMDWDGNLLWSFTPNDPRIDLIGDFQRQNNGQTIITAKRMVRAPMLAEPGPTPANLVAGRGLTSGKYYDDLILRVGATGELLDMWSTLEHVDQLALGENTLANIAKLPGNGPKDVFKMNSVQAMPPNTLAGSNPAFSAGNWLVSYAGINRVVIVEPSSGQVVWIMPYTLTGPFHARMIPQSLPGGGNILLFDSGAESGYPTVCRVWSQIVEFDPATSSVVWTYDTWNTSPNNSAFRHTFFSQGQGGMQRLANGNTLITDGDWGRVFEITPGETIVWEFMKADYKQLYRSYRVDSGWQNNPLGAWAW